MFSDAVYAEVAAILAKAPPVDLTDRRVLLANLVFIYHVIKASENLLVVAASRTEPGTRLHQYFERHRAEEVNHDKWLAEDLTSAGINVASTLIPRQAVELAGTQYYLIHHVDPAALLGYMAVLEGFPHPIDAVERLEEIHGKELLRTLRHHAIHDVDHRRDLNETINGLTERQKALVFESAIQTACYLASAITSLP